MRSIPLSLTLLATLSFPLVASAQSKDKSADGDKWESEDGKKADPAAKKDPQTGVEPPAEVYDPTNVEETPGKSYFFVGLRYRGNIIPKFMLNMFVDEGKTVYTNLIGVEFEVRKDGFSLIPALSYHELGTDDIIFKQKNKKDIPGNYGLVNSGMKLIYASVDVLWSTKIH